MTRLSSSEVIEYLESEAKIIEHAAKQLQITNSDLAASLQGLALGSPALLQAQEKTDIGELFRDAAIILGKSDLNSAFALMKLAHKFKPNGPYIKKKLDELDLMRGATKLDTYDLNNLKMSAGDVPPPALLQALVNGNYEKDEVSLLLQFLTKGEVVLELGAGIGFMGINAMKTGLCERYVAYEANPTLIPIIIDNMARNNVSFEVHNQLLVEGCGCMPFYITPAFWASSLVQPKEGEYEVVNVETVDKNQVIHAVMPSMLIVDIEGGESALFDQLDLKFVKKIIIEIHPRVLSDKALSDIYKTLLIEGFTLNFNESFKNVLYWYR